MSGLRRYRPSPAMVVACAALLVALGGTSYAAFKLPRNSVGSPQIKRRAVQNRHLGRNAVRTANVLNGSLLASDFKAGELQAAVLTVLPSRRTIRGVYAASGTAPAAGETARDAPTFVPPMPTAWDSRVVRMNAPKPPECPGDVESPEAAPGILCVYEAVGVNSALATDYPAGDNSARFGWIAQVTSLAAGAYQSRGTWAITAP